MKKLIIAAIAALPVLFACGKSDPTPTPEPEPKTAESSVTIETKNDNLTAEVKGTKVILKKIDFFRTGRYLMTVELATKAEEEVLHYSGTFTYKDGVYSCSGDFTGTIAVTGSGSSAQASVNGGEKADVNSKPANVSGGSFEDFLYKTWKITDIDLALTNPQVTQGIVCDGGQNIAKAIDIANKYNAGIDDKYKAYNVKEISLNPGVFMVTFSNSSTFGGEIKNLNKSGEGCTFTYKFTEQLASGVVASEASASAKKDGNNLVVSVNVSTSKLSGKITIKLASAN